MCARAISSSLSNSFCSSGVMPSITRFCVSSAVSRSIASSSSPREVGRRLMEVIAHNKGGTNKDLGKFADQLRALIEKWDR